MQITTRVGTRIARATGLEHGYKSLVVASILLIWLIDSAGAQYNYQSGSNYGSGSYGDGGGGGGGEHDGGMDDRPKVNLGIRLRIPAFKFELPRFNLPKITVSAKIRQPEGPRVIQLPEINLDTSSKSELPGNKGDGGHRHGYQRSPAYEASASDSYGRYGNTGMISFSTEEEHPTHYDQHQTMAYKTTGRQTHSAAYGQQQQGRYNYQTTLQQRPRQPSYLSASDVQPTYWAHGSGQVASSSSQSMNQYQHQPHEDKNPDYGFNLPAYVSPSAAGTK